MPAPSPHSFLALCKSAKISLPTTAANMKKFLESAGTLPILGSPRVDGLRERCAAVAWVQNAVANKLDPDTWSSTLDASLLPTLMSLYNLPPATSSGGPPQSELVRLARVVAMYLPAGVADAASSAGDVTVIDTSRPDGAAKPPAPAPQASVAAPAPKPQLPLASPGKRRWMMHDDLRPLLDDAVYHALDASAGLKAGERSKLHKACKEDVAGTLLDNTVAAAFGHQFTLSLAEGSRFDPLKRGLALAAAGRSATSASSLSDVTDEVNRDNHTRLLRSQWQEMLSAFAKDQELSGTIVSRLWNGVTFVMRIRAARAATWNVAEVSTACRTQADGLQAYRAAIASALALASAAYPDAEAARFVNKAYLEFFLPFWWEHVLLRSALEEEKAAAEVKLILAPPAPAPAAPAAAPAPLPFPLPTPPPALHPLHGAPPPYFPFPPPPFFGPPPPGYPHAPHHGGHAAGAPAPHFTPTATLQPAFLGKPSSKVIVGDSLGLPGAIGGKACTCAISLAFPGTKHIPAECPIRYHQRYNRCPGWTAAGTRIPACWVGNELTPACRADWKDFAAPLITPRAAGTFVVNF